MRKIMCLILCVFTLSLAGCQNQQADSQDKKQVVTTTTMIYDLVSTIAQDNLEVSYLMGPGVDPHLYQASANDVLKLQNADLVVYNGVHLEGKMADVFNNLASNQQAVICLEDSLKANDLIATNKAKTTFDPHIWFSVANWMKASDYVTERLMEFDPEHASEYQKNNEAYQIELSALDEYIKGRVQELAKEQRILVTAHDAFSYFGKDYGFIVKGIQGVSTDSEAGTLDISNLANYIVEHQIKAIFIESSVPKKTVEALQAAVLSKGSKVEIGGQLYSDSLGDKQANAETYIKTFKANIDTIIDALN